MQCNNNLLHVQLSDTCRYSLSYSAVANNRINTPDFNHIQVVFINEFRIGVCKVPLNFLEEEHVLFHAAMWCHLHRIFSTLYYLSHYVDLLLTTQCCKKGYISDTKQVCGIQIDIINMSLKFYYILRHFIKICQTKHIYTKFVILG